jgi:hypothetical protein
MHVNGNAVYDVTGSDVGTVSVLEQPSDADMATGPQPSLRNFAALPTLILANTI